MWSVLRGPERHFFAGPAACVGHDLPIAVVDGDGDATGHHAFRAKARSEVHEGLQSEASLGEGGMVPLELVQPELERRVRAVAFRLRLR